MKRFLFLAAGLMTLPLQAQIFQHQEKGIQGVFVENRFSNDSAKNHLHQAFAAQVINDSIGKTMPIQFSIFPPISSNGFSNENSINSVSINLFAGYAGGLNGVELGGFANVLKHDMQGIQVAGFTNVTGGKSQGLQVAGFCNVNQKSVKGIQISGFTNVVSDSVKGMQYAGFCNVNAGNMNGVQVAGFVNLNQGSFSGVQTAGFLNATNDSMNGIQISGFLNYASETVNGIQTAGFMNIALTEISGIQISGFLNYTSKLKGIQLGFINITDTLESGTPLGFLSFVRKGGYKAFELSANETFPVTVQFKTGSNQFYNIFSLSGKPGKDVYWGWGYGIGSNLKSNGRFRMNIELQATHVNTDVWWSKNLNLLNKLHLGFTWQAAKHFAIIGGPTFNVLVTHNQGEFLNNSAAGITPWTVFDKDYTESRVQMWPGAQFSLRF